MEQIVEKIEIFRAPKEVNILKTAKPILVPEKMQKEPAKVDMNNALTVVKNTYETSNIFS